jgi:hypothetical protein
LDSAYLSWAFSCIYSALALPLGLGKYKIALLTCAGVTPGGGGIVVSLIIIA